MPSLLALECLVSAHGNHSTDHNNIVCSKHHHHHHRHQFDFRQPRSQQRCQIMNNHDKKNQHCRPATFLCLDLAVILACSYYIVFYFFIFMFLILFFSLLTVYFVYDFYNHRQRGSDCTVLTATGLVNGKWKILTPTESKPLNRSTKNFAHVITSARRRCVPNLVKIRPRGASGQIGEI